MTSALRRGAIALAGVLFASAGLGLTDAGIADGRSVTGACSDAMGVTVVVDFGAAGGGVQTRCAPAPVANGFDALTRAGFTIRNVSSQPGFLCQIDGQPAGETCTHVPASSSYWSYWHASRGQPWTYSTSGASRKPPPGSVEGWSFGSSDPPGVDPPGPITTTTTAPASPGSTSAPPPTGVVSPPTSTTGGSSPPPSSADGGTSTTVMGAAGDDPTTTEGSDAGAGTGGATSLDEEAASARSDDDGGGSPAGVLMAGVLVAIVGLGGARTVRRRAARDADG